MPEQEQRARIYLDNAATSWPKPPAVYEAVEQYMRGNGSAAGRGVYESAQQVARLITSARRSIATLLGVQEHQRIVFSTNGTDSLNLALHGLLRPGDHVITTEAEHNSVLRPLSFLRQHREIDVTYLPVDATGRVNPDDLRGAIRPATRLLAVTHASNVTGTIQPLGELLPIARQADLFTLVDAAQSAGHLPLDMETTPIDLLAASGHKGLLGPLGTGVLYVGPRVEPHLLPLRQGGTGSQSELDMQPEELPDRFESGNLNVPGIVGLERSTAWLLERGIAEVRRHEQQIVQQILSGLEQFETVEVFGSLQAEDRVGVVSLRLAGYDPQELATILDAEFGIQCRSGLHCAPRIHRAIGTLQSGGTLRLSAGAFTTADQIDTLLEALSQLVSHTV